MFELTPCTYLDIKELKSRYDIEFVPFDSNYDELFKIKSIEANDFVGLIKRHISPENYFYITWFEVFNKGKGYGKQIIEDLQKKLNYEGIKCNPGDDVIEFWMKCKFYPAGDQSAFIWIPNK
jgi:hypothetical protein